MALDYKYCKVKWDGAPIDSLIKLYNNTSLPDAVIERIRQEFDTMPDPVKGETILIPILPPFQKKHSNLVDKDGAPVTAAPEPKPKAKPAVSRPEPKKVEPIATKELPKEEPPKKKKRTTKPTAIVETKQKISGIKFKVFPFIISSSSNTIEAIIRNYNDMNMSRPVLNKLVYEFCELNKDKMPPRLGQTVQVPVLLPFVYRHENNNKVK